MHHLNCRKCPPLAPDYVNLAGKIRPEKVSSGDTQDQHCDGDKLTVIFAQADKVRGCQTCKARFAAELRIPDFWWSSWCKRLNGYFGSEDTVGQDGELDGSNTWCRFLVKQIFKERNRDDEMIHYRWLKLNIFARWNASTKEHIIISFIAKSDTRNLLMDHLNKTANTIHPESPRSVYDSLAQLAVELQEDAVWSIRDAVRDVETSRAILIPQNPNPKQNFCSLHDLARHAIHVSETLDLAAQTLQSMIECHGRLAAGSAIPLRGNQDDIDRNGTGIARIADQKHTTYNHLRFYQDAIEGLRSRSIANKDRLQNEIQYSFNLVAQDIARTSNDIARISNGAQQAIQSDSSIMKTIALGTAIFIPMTFVATVFSMSFFVYAVEDSRWKMSGKFWVFWVVALPFTSLTVLASYYYHRQDKPSPLRSTRGSLDHVDLIGMLGVENRR